MVVQKGGPDSRNVGGPLFSVLKKVADKPFLVYESEAISKKVCTFTFSQARVTIN